MSLFETLPSCTHRQAAQPEPAVEEPGDKQAGDAPMENVTPTGGVPASSGPRKAMTPPASPLPAKRAKHDGGGAVATPGPDAAATAAMPQDVHFVLDGSLVFADPELLQEALDCIKANSKGRRWR